MPAPHPPPIEPPPAPGAFLFSAEQLAEITDAETKHGIYTAARCPDNKKRAIVRLTIEGTLDDYEIAQIIQVDRRTIHAVRNDPECAAEIDKARQTFAPKLRRVAWSQLDRLERSPNSLPAQGIAFAVERLLTQAALEEGKATARVEHVERVDIFARFEEVCRQYLPTDDDVKLAHAREVIPEKNGAAAIHFDGGKTLLMPGAGSSGPAAADPGQESPAHRGSDWQSDVSGSPAQVKEGQVTTLPTDQPGNLAAGAEGETETWDPAGGGSSARNAGPTATDKSTQNFMANGDPS